MAVSINWGVVSLAVLITEGLLTRVYIRAADSWKPHMVEPWRRSLWWK